MADTLCATPARRLVLCAATLGLLILSFPTTDAWPLAYFALVPWLMLIVSSSQRQVAFYSWLLGLAFFGYAVFWICFVTIPGWISLVAYLSLYLPAFGLLALVLRERLRLPLVVVAPVVWVGLEYVRSFMLSGFPWFYLGHTQYQKLAMVQVSDLAGAYAVSFILAMVNGALADGWVALRREGGLSKALRPMTPTLAATALVLTATFGYGIYRLREYRPIEGPRVATVQGDLPQRIKDDPNSARDVLDMYLRISEEAVGQGAALLVWPETMVPGFMNIATEDRWHVKAKDVNDFARECVTRLRDLGHRAGARLLVGGQALDVVGELKDEAVLSRFNSAYYMDPKDLAPPPRLLGRYDKIELVPFGEYTPLKRYFPFLSRMVPYETGFEAGNTARVFDLHGTRFGVLICYEDTIPSLVRKFRQGGAQFLVNISNDGWFEGSMELDAHLAICTFRAVENRVGIVRSVNTGISGFISPTGRIEGVVSRNGQRKNVEGVLTQNVSLDSRTTLYSQYGDWLGQGSMALCILLAALSVAHGKKA